MKMNLVKLYHNSFVNGNVQNKPFITFLHLQRVIIFSTYSKMNSTF